jgi:hypothetical protein
MRSNDSVAPSRAAQRADFRTARILAIATAALTVTMLASTFASAMDAPGKRRASHWHGYGFLPGYTPPDKFDPLRAPPYGSPYWYGYPSFYKGRWNGGGFGPCWTKTPIGNVWNCG